MKKSIFKPILIVSMFLLIITLSGCKKENADPNTVTDIDGNVYGIIKIGNQEWLDMNLNVTHYRNGDPISNGLDVPEGTGAWINYGGSEANGAVYGKLYNSFAVHDARGLAPEGWRVPTRDDFEELIAYLGGYAVAGGKLKETGLQHWLEPNTDAADEFGFGALPGGYASPGGTGTYLGNYGSFWTSTRIREDTNETFNIWVYYNNATVERDSDYGRSGYSVRCVRDR